MSLLKSTISDAGSGKAMQKSSSGSSTINGSKTFGTDGNAFKSRSITSSKENISTGSNLQSQMTQHNHFHLPSDSYSDPFSKTSDTTTHGELKTSFKNTQNDNGIVSDTTSAVIDETKTRSTLSVNNPTMEVGNVQDHETSLPLIEKTFNTNVPQSQPPSETDSSHDKNQQVSAQTEQNSVSILNYEISENSAITLPPDTSAQLIIEKDKHDIAIINKTMSSNTLSKNISNAKPSSNTIDMKNIEQEYEDVAKNSVKNSFKAELTQQKDSSKTNHHRHNSTQIPIINSNYEQQKQTTHKVGNSSLNSINTSQELLSEVNKASHVQSKEAAIENSTDKEKTATIHNSMNDANLELLAQLSAAKAVQEKSLNHVSAQVQPARTKAKVLNNNPIFQNNYSPTAKTAYGTSVEVSKAPEVKIGQVDVFIEAPHRSNTTGTSTSRPSPSLSSRHYLRRL